MTELELLYYNCKKCNACFMSYKKVIVTISHWYREPSSGTWSKKADQVMTLPDREEVTDNSYISPVYNKKLCKKCYEISLMRSLDCFI